MSSEKVYVNQPLTSRKIMALLDQNPDLKEISCPTSIYLRTSSKYLEALEELGINVKSVERRGQPKKYSQKDRVLVNKLLKEGKTPKQISGQMGIPLKSVYYLKKDLKLKKGRKSKYNEKTHITIKKMAKQGVSAKEISLRLKIPLRTVYHILKR